jgi:hypothetical protein
VRENRKALGEEERSIARYEKSVTMVMEGSLRRGVEGVGRVLGSCKKDTWENNK